jgi:Domain of unknown function (DUF4440)
MLTTYLRYALLFLLFFNFSGGFSIAQNNANNLSETVLQKEDLFWAGYNSCDYAQLGEFVAEDVEFYHDKGSITLGKSALVDSIKNNICGNPKMRIRREADTSTVKIYLLNKADVVYGAIISGDHFFINSYDGQPEKREGIAKFMNLWVLKDNVWKMSRILSYDHRSVPYINTRKAQPLTQNVLRRFAGEYSGSKTGTSIVETTKSALKLTGGNSEFILYPETNNRFFVEERDLTFEFIAGSGRISKLIIRENGKIVDELTRMK